MTKKILIFSLAIILLVLSVIPAAAQEKINDFQAEIKVNLDGTINVSETISYNFGNLEKHGIYRIIPMVKTNQDGKKYKLDIKVLGVTDQLSSRYPTKYQLLEEGDNLKIKIGDPDITVTGSRMYTIEYQVSGSLTYFSDHDELYWNVTGNEWLIPIGIAGAKVTLPEEVNNCHPEQSPAPSGAGRSEVSPEDKGILKQVQDDGKKSCEAKTICYTGVSSSKEQACQSSKLSANSYQISTTRALNPKEGLTIAVSFPKGIVAVLQPKEQPSFASLSNLYKILIAIITVFWYFVLPLLIILWWYLKGRDPNVGKPVTAWYDPPKDSNNRFLTPAEVGTLVDEKVDQKDVTATIVSLAIKGYLTIKEKKKKTLIFESTEYSFIKKKGYENDPALQEHELLILDKFFSSRDEVSTDDLTSNFYTTVEKFKNNLYKKVVDLGFFPANPNSVRNKYMIFAVIALFLGGNLPLTIVLFIVGYNMPKKTVEGAKAHMIALGLKNFLSSQERQLEFQVKNWFTFEKLLPFAVVFGVEKIWAERFKDLEVVPPDWYQGSYGSTFNTLILAGALSRSMSSMNSMSMSPTRSSTGFSSGFSGGSSGGGGGGGGGGSW